jgi:hypothetical protein
MALSHAGSGPEPENLLYFNLDLIIMQLCLFQNTLPCTLIFFCSPAFAPSASRAVCLISSFKTLNHLLLVNYYLLLCL